MRDPSGSCEKLRLLLVDDEQTIRVTLGLCLEADGHEVVTCANASEALAAVSRTAFDLIFLDLRLGMDNGLDLIPRLLEQNPWSRIVIITAYASIDTAVEAMKRGAADYLPKPFTPAQVELVTQKVAKQRQLEQKLQALQDEMGKGDPEQDFPTSSAQMREALEVARKVARSQVTVCIEGEVGTGKERLARAIHGWSDRWAGPFASASCVTERAEDLEADLFGVSPLHRERTVGGIESAPGVSSGRVGFCEGGTLLLKEVVELPVSLQPKIARLLRDREYERVGEFGARRSDCRVIVTSRTNMDDAAGRGSVRPDLAMAANVVGVRIPPLRERPEDIALLAERFLAHAAREHQRRVSGISVEAMDVLRRHAYPGNSRELRNLIERAVLICRGEEVGVEHLPTNLLNSDSYRVGDLVPLETITDLHIKQVLASTRSYESAASVLGINSITLWRRRKRYNA